MGVIEGYRQEKGEIEGGGCQRLGGFFCDLDLACTASSLSTFMHGWACLHGRSLCSLNFCQAGRRDVQLMQCTASHAHVRCPAHAVYSLPCTRARIVHALAMYALAITVHAMAMHSTCHDRACHGVA
eukprot:361630-Chlamydomonas_euryale.AAC.9